MVVVVAVIVVIAVVVVVVVPLPSLLLPDLYLSSPLFQKNSRSGCGSS